MTRTSSITLLLLAVCTSCSQGPKEVLHAEASDLKPGVSTTVKTLKAHQADTFKLDLDSGAFVFGFADQISFDAVVDIFGPDKKKVSSWDRPSRGHEDFQLKTAATGVYKLVVSPFEEESGDYSLTLSGASPIATDIDGRITQEVTAMLGTNPMSPGATIAVQQNGKIVYSKGFGYADLESERKNTPQTVFHIASVSKQVTAFAIAMLADQGKLSIDDDIRKYLPEMYDFGTPITINHLVHHTSGLRDQWNLLMMAGWRLDDVITQKQIMRIISKQRELNFKPGDEHLYCNTGFTLMAEIVNRVTGQSFEEWTRKNIFEPLEMKSTFFYDDHERVVPNRAYSYYLNQRTQQYKKNVLNYANAGATSLFTTVEDLSLWALNYETMKVGNANVMRMMEQRFILTKGDTISYAFGQAKGDYKGLNTWSHGGGDAGYRTFLVRFPDHHFSVTVFSNYASFNPGGLSYTAADFYLGKEMKPPKPEEPSQQSQNPPPPPIDKSSVKLSEFTGSFYSPELETTYTFEVVSDTLRAHHQRHNDLNLNPTKTDGFNTGFLGAIEFVRDKSGKVIGFKASNGRVRNLRFDKVKQ